MKTLVYTHFYNYTNPSAEVTTDLEYYLNTPADIKIAIVEANYTCNQQRVNRILEQVKDSDLVVYRTVEASGFNAGLVQKFDALNFVFILGFIPNFELEYSVWHCDPYWIRNASNCYSIAEVDALLADVPKQYSYEVMYGLAKPHRSFVYEWIDGNNAFAEAPFLTTSSMDYNTIGDTTSLFWEDNLIRNDDGTVTFMNAKMPLSHVIPFKLYNESAYSIICETDLVNRYSFFTEKIAKPIIAGRLFVVISGQYYLQNLRKLGFKTFSNVIDESYDLIENNEERWNAAMTAASTLIAQDQQQVLSNCKEIFKHNRNVITAITQEFSDTNNIINEYINQLFEQE